MTGRLHVGTSGYSYPAWAPRFYQPGTRADALLPAYASRLSAVELSATWYRQPTPAQVATWTRHVPEHFRFTVKLLRTGSLQAYATDPAGTLEWLLAPLAGFGSTLGAALFRIPQPHARNDARLERLLDAWPAAVPLALEAQDPSWHVDETFERLRASRGGAGAAIVLTETDDAIDPPLNATGPFLYLRLRRSLYGTADLDAWAARLEPFLADGRDAFVFFRHDEDGATPLFAEALAARLPGYSSAGGAAW